MLMEWQEKALAVCLYICNWHTDKYVHMRNSNRIRMSSVVRQLNVVSCVFVRMCHQVIRVKVMSLTTTVARLSQFSKSDLILLTA